MNEKTCPHLGIIGPETEQISARDYPSFENCCFVESDRTGVDPSHGTLLLADQSTYCLSGGYHQCPRFQSISLQSRPYAEPHIDEVFLHDYQFADTFDIPTTSIPLDSDHLSASVEQPAPSFDDSFDTHEFDDDGDNEENGLNPAWLLAGTTFVSVFLLGIGLALYLGWQLISNSAIADVGSGTVIEAQNGSNLNGSDITLVNVGNEDQALYVVQTATPEPDALAAAEPANVDSPASDVAADSGESAPTAVGELAIVSDAASDSDQNEAQPALQGSENRNQNGNSNNNPVAQEPIQQNFPAAVTPTAIVVAIADNAGQSNTQANLGANQIVQPSNITAPGDNQQPAFIPATPSPRPQPQEIPVIALDAVVPETTGSENIGNIGEPEPTATNTPEPTATWPPPLVFFSSVDKQLREGKCTTLTWDVQNVRAVYVASIGVDGKGEKEVCINDKAKIYDLMVVLPDGGTKLYTTTVDIELPTPTPTVTWTYTPLPVPTATWTPVPPTPLPTATPTPLLARGVRLETAQPQAAAPISCMAGTTCEIGLWATNTGEGVDNLIIVIAERSQPAWSALICKYDGTCSTDRLIQTEVGQGNAAFITMRLNPPADAAGQNATYSLYAVSQASGETVRSDVVVLNISTP